MKINTTPKLSALAAYIVTRWGNTFSPDRDVTQVLSVPGIGEIITRLARGYTLYEPDQKPLDFYSASALVITLSTLSKCTSIDLGDETSTWGPTEGSVVFYRLNKSHERSISGILCPILVQEYELDEKAQELYQKKFSHLSHKEMLELPIDAERFDILVYVNQVLAEARAES
jgi:hypothetical protein